MEMLKDVRDEIDLLNECEEQATKIVGTRGYEAGVKSLLQALKMARSVLGNNHRRTGLLCGKLGISYQSLHRHGEAVPMLQESLKILRANGEKNNPLLPYLCTALGAIHMSSDEYDEAGAQLREALRIRLAVLGRRNVETARAYTALGFVLTNQGGHDDEAIEMFNNALAIKRKLFGEKDSKVVKCMLHMGMAHVNKREGTEAIFHLERALALYNELGQTDHQVMLCYMTLSAAYSNQGETDKALALGEQAVRSCPTTRFGLKSNLARQVRNFVEHLREQIASGDMKPTRIIRQPNLFND